jgi:hypothetical protein
LSTNNTEHATTTNQIDKEEDSNNILAIVLPIVSVVIVTCLIILIVCKLEAIKTCIKPNKYRFEETIVSYKDEEVNLN